MNEHENLELLNSENVEATTEETQAEVIQPEKVYTEEELEKIKEFAAFVKASRK